MPELPEVEVVRRGLSRWVVGRRIANVEVFDPRSTRRHVAGAESFSATLRNAVISDVVRRGKFLWMPLDLANQIPAGDCALADDGGGQFALMAHLGMSGQLLMQDAARVAEKHLKVQLSFEPSDIAPEQLRFVDQRIFGGLFIDPLIPTSDGLPGGLGQTALPLIPEHAAHIGRDPLDQAFSVDGFYRRLRARRTGIKRALLDQTLISGIGNIYADEALWAARIHFARATDSLRRSDVLRLVDAVREVMVAALAAGGTSFDSLYVNVNGASGYFERSLNAYGREGQLCPRCAAASRNTLIRRDAFMNR
nr:bifunctional DNA-formamidopyrimidine glycosylase/DNA-(apurinic or apyrimidinic site) lyase [Acidobacteriota bacterium]